MEEIKEYHGVQLIASDAEILEQIEKIIGKEIPCRANRDKIKEDYAQARQAAQPATTQMSAETILNQQAQAYKAQMAQLEQMSQLPIEQLESTYVSQYMAQVNPTMKASLEQQLNMLLPMYGENHPAVTQIKSMLEMDEDKAQQKGKAMALFMQENFKLQVINKQESQWINQVIFTQISLEELEKESLNYYNSMLTPEYQAQLKITLDVGIQPDGGGIGCTSG